MISINEKGEAIFKNVKFKSLGVGSPYQALLHNAEVVGHLAEQRPQFVGCHVELLPSLYALLPHPLLLRWLQLAPQPLERAHLALSRPQLILQALEKRTHTQTQTQTSVEGELPNPWKIINVKTHWPNH